MNKKSKYKCRITVAKAMIISAIIAGIFGLISKINFNCLPNQTKFVGCVRDKSTELPIRNAKVALEVQDVPQITYTDSEGIFSFLISKKNTEIRIRIEVYDYKNYDRRTIPSKKIEDIFLEPEAPPIEFVGCVRDKSTKLPIQNAKVVFEVQDVPLITYTDSVGIFSFPINDRTKELHIRIEANSYNNCDRRIISSPKNEIKNIFLEKKPHIKEHEDNNNKKSDQENKPHTVHIKVNLNRAGAKVFVDNEPEGTAPCSVTLDKGIHQIRLEYKDIHANLNLFYKNQIVVPLDTIILIESDEFIIN